MGIVHLYTLRQTTWTIHLPSYLATLKTINEIMSDDLMRQQQTAVGMINGFGSAAKIGLRLSSSAPMYRTQPAIRQWQGYKKPATTY